MTRRIRWIALLGVFFMAAMPSLAGDDVTLEGGFVWEREDGDREGDLKAVLTPTGDGEWDVSFHFEWEDSPRIFTGTCSGSLDGELSGDITSDGDREMKFKFSGSFEDGTFNGTHGFVTKEGELKQAGKLMLGSPKS
ncbi:MAG: hypothetical protein V3S47_03510 [Acidobacteriota bacterium]